MLNFLIWRLRSLSGRGGGLSVGEQEGGTFEILEGGFNGRVYPPAVEIISVSEGQCLSQMKKEIGFILKF